MKPWHIGPAVLSLVLVALVFSGCPEIEVTSMTIKPGSISGNRLTLSGNITVTEQEPEYADAGALVGMHGLFGFWVPEGVRVTEVRVRRPGDTAFRPLPADPAMAKAMPEPFPPQVPGIYSFFPLECLYIEKGAWIYKVEIDLEVTESIRKPQLGLFIGYFMDGCDIKASELFRIQVDRESQAVSVIDPRRGGDATITIRLAEEQLCKDNERHFNIPYPTCEPKLVPGAVPAVKPGPRGCSCDTVGSVGQRPGWIRMLWGSIF